MFSKHQVFETPWISLWPIFSEKTSDKKTILSEKVGLNFNSKLKGIPSQNGHTVLV